MHDLGDDRGVRGHNAGLHHPRCHASPLSTIRLIVQIICGACRICELLVGAGPVGGGADCEQPDRADLHDQYRRPGWPWWSQLRGRSEIRLADWRRKLAFNRGSMLRPIVRAKHGSAAVRPDLQKCCGGRGFLRFSGVIASHPPNMPNIRQAPVTRRFGAAAVPALGDGLLRGAAPLSRLSAPTGLFLVVRGAELRHDRGFHARRPRRHARRLRRGLWGAAMNRGGGHQVLVLRRPPVALGSVGGLGGARMANRPISAVSPRPARSVVISHHISMPMAMIETRKSRLFMHSGLRQRQPEQQRSRPCPWGQA